MQRFEVSLNRLNRETTMSNTPKQSAGKNRQQPKGKENGEKRKNTDKAANGAGTRSIQQGRFIIAAPMQWVTMLMQFLTLLPGKPGGPVGAYTVDDVIRVLTTTHLFRCDVDLAIDVFRELKEKRAEDCYGQRFNFSKFKEFVNQHPLLSRGLKYDAKFRSDWFQSRKASKYTLMRKEAFREDYNKSLKMAEMRQQSKFLTWLEEDKEISLKEFNECPESIRKTLLKDFSEPMSVLWPHKDISTRKIQATKGEPISKGKYERAFNNQYDNNEIGQQNIPRAYSLNYTAKVQPDSEVVLDGTMSFRRPIGDFVSYEGRWYVVQTPWKGDGEFYLAKTFKVGTEKINPAYGHLLFAHPKKDQGLISCNSSKVIRAHHAWKTAGTRKCGWNPRRELAPSYGAEFVKAIDEGLIPDFKDGHWLYIDGDWKEVSKEKKPVYPKKNNATPVKPHRGKPGKYVPKEEN